MELFSKAQPVWCKACAEQPWNQFAGFVTILDFPKEEEVTILIAARSYYRLYINGAIAAHGPARAAHGYARVDRIRRVVSGRIAVAVEAASLSNPAMYANDCTLEPGMITCEIRDQTGNAVAWTGRDFVCKALTIRRSLVETMSHCRGAIEWYDLDEHSLDWRLGQGDGFDVPAQVSEPITFLPRRAPYASLRALPMRTVSAISDWAKGESTKISELLLMSRIVQQAYYAEIPPENLCFDQLLSEKAAPFTGKAATLNSDEILLIPGENPAAVVYEQAFSEVGFIDFTVQVDALCTLDVLHTDHLEKTGEFRGNTDVTRYSLQAGMYHLTTFEPKLVRYIQFVFRTKGKVFLKAPAVLDFSYPDNSPSFFSCNDGELNRIYEAARRTLRLCTADIFMDCPERERGGWLCDSLFLSKGAWQMFSDLSVEKDFLENYLLTDGSKTWNGFFPEVYPASKGTQGNVGITTWFRGLIEELWDYVRRSGDREMIWKHRTRVEAFVEGLLSLQGASGLIENLPTQFVDWSLSNQEACLRPISIPNNCLAVDALEKLSKLYQNTAWAAASNHMRRRIEALPALPQGIESAGDSAMLENGARKAVWHWKCGAAFIPTTKPRSARSWRPWAAPRRNAPIRTSASPICSLG